MVIENDTPCDERDNRRAANLRLRVETGPVFLSNIYNISVLASLARIYIYNEAGNIIILIIEVETKIFESFVCTFRVC